MLCHTSWLTLKRTGLYTGRIRPFPGRSAHLADPHLKNKSGQSAPELAEIYSNEKALVIIEKYISAAIQKSKQ